MTTLFGKVCLSPEGDGGTPNDEKTEDTVTVKVGGTETSLQALMDSDAAGTIKVNVGDGKEVTLKTLREAARREPDTQRILDEVNAEREKIATDREAMLAEVKAERDKVVEQMREGSTDQATKIANALLSAAGKGPNQDPFRDKASAIAYVSDLLLTKQDGVGALSGLIDRMFSDKEATAAELKKMAEDIKGWKAEVEAKHSTEAVEAFMREEAAKIQREFPDYDPDPETTDPFSILVQRLMTKKTPDAILDNKVGQKTPAVEVARLVDSHLGKKADARVKAKEDAQKKRDDTEAMAVRNRGGRVELPDELQKELDAAGTDVDKINAVGVKIAALHRKR
jgi:hypothetical protein